MNMPGGMFQERLAGLAKQAQARLPERMRWITRLPAWAWGSLALAAILLTGRLTGAGVRPVASSAAVPAAVPAALPGTAALAFDTLAKLGIVLALFYFGVYALRRWRKYLPHQSERRIALVETTRLSQRQALHLVRVGGQLLLIGATDQGLSLLTEVEEKPAAPAYDFSAELALRQNRTHDLPGHFSDFRVAQFSGEMGMCVENETR